MAILRDAADTMKKSFQHGVLSPLEEREPRVEGVSPLTIITPSDLMKRLFKLLPLHSGPCIIRGPTPGGVLLLEDLASSPLTVSYDCYLCALDSLCSGIKR